MNFRTALLAMIASLSLIVAGVAEAGSSSRSGTRTSSIRTSKTKTYKAKPWKPYPSTVTTQQHRGFLLIPGGSSEEPEDCDVGDWLEGDEDCAGLSGPNAID